MQNKKFFEDPFLKILPKLDLHGETRDVVKYLVSDFVHINRKMGHLKVQIVHGRHGGILKKEAHDVLKKCDGVERFYMYGSNDGITIVELSPIIKNS